MTIVKKIFKPANSPDGTCGSFPSKGMPADQDTGAYCIPFQVPVDFVSLHDVHPIVYCNTTGTMQWEMSCTYAKTGEDFSTDSYDSKETALTGGVVSDVQDVVTSSLEVGDFVVVYFERKGSKDSLDATVHFLGVLIEYNAKEVENLGDLGDVELDSPVEGEALKLESSKWKNKEAYIPSTNYTEVKTDDNPYYAIGEITITKGVYGSTTSKVKVDFTWNGLKRSLGSHPCHWRVSIKLPTNTDAIVTFTDTHHGRVDFSTGNLEFTTPPNGEYQVVVEIW